MDSKEMNLHFPAAYPEEFRELTCEQKLWATVLISAFYDLLLGRNNPQARLAEGWILSDGPESWDIGGFNWILTCVLDLPQLKSLLYKEAHNRLKVETKKPSIRKFRLNRIR